LAIAEKGCHIFDKSGCMVAFRTGNKFRHAEWQVSIVGHMNAAQQIFS
jgi:hypothetical protein